MPLLTQSLLMAFKLPQDADAEHAAVCALIRAARVSLYIRMFGFTDESKADAVADAHDAGVDVRLILDKLQAKGKPEIAALTYLCGARGFPEANIQRRSSPHGAYMHDKLIIRDANADVPDAQFTDYASALAALYPITCAGSTNWSSSAEHLQDNLSILLPSKVLAAWLAEDFEAQWATPL